MRPGVDQGVLADDPELLRLLDTKAREVGGNIRRLAEERGISIRRLIGRSDLNHQTVYNVLQGRANPTLKTLLQLAVVLEVDVRAFFETEAEGAVASSEMDLGVKEATPSADRQSGGSDGNSN